MSPSSPVPKVVKIIKTLPFGEQQAPATGFGTTGLNYGMGTTFDFERSEPVLLKAAILGCTFWDTAVPSSSPPKTPLEESIGALDELRRTGKTEYIGLSECPTATSRRAHAIAKIDASQAECTAFETVRETSGLIETATELRSGLCGIQSAGTWLAGA
ncbi:hypothetical protein ABOM_007985 [Aspergillus bombycis]|uniref:NADP-dependent oxidoreductase domain-containing protein n=1 Tax=Aspergillus bombycis TaxID=109264 RepID=A0A1F7ZXJ7_9EURO|nr:hypothetical protein ABOM_007985 [Aspergillus bombycis]OGM43979.1 hypothetical protein ABOM_007985 [Aspergillus bombycis]